MSNPFHLQLAEHYLRQGIHPQKFNCQHQSFCRNFADQGNMTETKMSLVGSHYGDKYPKILVLSLDPPLGEKGIFSKPEQRTTEYITATTEAENYTVNRPNVHWAMTQIIVKDLLSLFGYQSKPGAAVVLESYAGGRVIENVTANFAHVNVAKCSMNKSDKGQANFSVHRMCSHSYLLQELEILQPDLLISQGWAANKITGELFRIPNAENELPNALKIEIGAGSTLWLPMVHPSRHISEIRETWPFYVQSVREWTKVKP